MPKLSLYKSHLEAARDRCSIGDEELAALRAQINRVPSGMQRIELDDFPVPFLRVLLEEAKLKPNQRAVLSLHIHGIDGPAPDREAIYRMEVANPIEFGSTFAMLGRQHPSAELSWNGRWYPILLEPEFQEDENKLARHVRLEATLSMGPARHSIRWPIDAAIFTDEGGEPVPRTVLAVIERLGLRRVQTPAAQSNLRLVNAERLGATAGTQVWVRGAVLETRARFVFGRTMAERPLGSVEAPRRAIVEPTLDDDQEEHGFYGRPQTEIVSRLPLVRVFSLDTKSYVFADVDDLVAYEYDATALSRLHLPEKMKHLLATLFATPAEQLFGDVIRGKHGGIVILASGNPGVGKTLTAEVYAEMTQRPLYVLEFGELGTTVREIEQHLEAVFARVVRWNAVLQFDECEIFLAQRGDDLERSAVVGIFLRLLDYYEGLLFLTTNRPESLDYAIRSRVMLRLAYPDLDDAGRAAVWRTMFAAAGLTLGGGTFDELAGPVVNGRQIRNLVRLARILHPAGTVTPTEMLALLEYGCR